MTAKATTAANRAPRSWLITALLASLAVAYVAFVFVPAQASIAKLRGQLNERRQHILQAQGLILPVEQMVRHVVQTREVSDAWREATPNPSELSDTFAHLTVEAKAAGVHIERLDPLPPEELQMLAQHAVNVQFRGEFAQVFDFLRRIELLPGTIWVSNLRMAGDQAGSGTLHGELNLTIFVDRTGSTDSTARFVR
jgi:Tfp pilus assembly protein PilO